MEVFLTQDQEAFIRQATETGRLRRKEEAVQEAMSLWEERERRLVEILVGVDRAEASLARGEGRRITTHEDVTLLAADIRGSRNGATSGSEHWCLRALRTKRAAGCPVQ
jgi:Arc/MetJ-type ribon-helix-helix transcriptional regulator